jgi:hypothetical protein
MAVHEFEFVATKLGVSVAELRACMELPRKTFRDYRSQQSIYSLGTTVLRMLGLQAGGKR